MQERYCYSKKGCFYHGSAKRCPICGGKTKEVRQDIYKPRKPDHDGYELREIKGGIMGLRAVKGVKRPQDMFSESESDRSDESDIDIWWKLPMPKSCIWKNGKKVSIYKGVKV
jgi:hypothetical protein